jgi:signal transduction histidine kinase
MPQLDRGTLWQKARLLSEAWPFPGGGHARRPRPGAEFGSGVQKKAIEEIIRDDSRAVETLRNVRTLFQRERVEMSPVDLRQIMLEAERVLSPEASGKGISLQLALPSAVPIVVGNRAQPLEVLMNLAANAFDSTVRLAMDRAW